MILDQPGLWSLNCLDAVVELFRMVWTAYETRVLIYGIEKYCLTDIVERYPTTTILLFNIAMENGPFIHDVPIKTSIYEGFSMAMLNNQRVSFLMLSRGMCINRKVSGTAEDESQVLGFNSLVAPEMVSRIANLTGKPQFCYWTPLELKHNFGTQLISEQTSFDTLW